LSRDGSRTCDIGNARYLASRIPGARLCEIDSEDHLCHLTHLEHVIDEIEEFTTGHRSEPPDDRYPGDTYEFAAPSSDNIDALDFGNGIQNMLRIGLPGFAHNSTASLSTCSRM
jgi:hypothetical protein